VRRGSSPSMSEPVGRGWATRTTSTALLRNMLLISSVTSSPSPIQVPAAIFLPLCSHGILDSSSALHSSSTARSRAPGTQQAIGRSVRLRLSRALFTSVQPLPSTSNAGPRDRFDRSIGRSRATVRPHQSATVQGLLDALVAVHDWRWQQIPGG